MSEVSTLRPTDLKELNKVSDYVAKNLKEVKELSDDFTNPSNFKLFWDSKIPKKDKAFYYFFSLSCSNGDDALNNIKIYQDFYNRFNDIITKYKQQRDTDCKEHHKMISDLDVALTKLVETAKGGENTTSSSAICKLHKSFIKKQEELEGLIKRVELVVVTEGWTKSVQAIKILRDDITNWKKEIVELYSAEKKELLEKQKLMQNDNQALLKKNEQMQKQGEVLVKKNEEMQKQGEELLKKHKETQAKQEKMLKSVEQMKRNHQEALLENDKLRQMEHEKLKETIQEMKKKHEEVLLESDKKRQEQQEKFIETIKEMKKEYQDTLLKTNLEILQQRQELLESVQLLKQQQDILLQENTAIKSKLETMSSQKSKEEIKRYYVS